MTVRICVVGLGVRGRGWLRAAQHVPEVEVCAAVDVVDRPEVRVPKFEAISEAVEGTGPDAVIIATPPELHREQVVETVRFGLPVLCEKPLSLELVEARRAVDAAAAAGVPFLVGMNFRFVPASGAIRSLASGGELGAPMFSEFTYITNRDGRHPGLNDFPLTMDDPMLMEQSIHHLDLMRFAYGREVTRVQADSWNPSTSVYRHAACVSALLTFEDDLKATYFGTWVSGNIRMEFAWRTDFEAGMAVQRDPFGDLYVSRLGTTMRRVARPGNRRAEPPRAMGLPKCVPFVTETEALLGHFVRVVQGVEEPGPTGLDHLRTLELLEACKLATTTGQAVRLPLTEG